LLLEFKEKDRKDKINLIPVIIEKVKEIPAIKYFSIDSVLQKTLSRIKILVMKIENAISVKLAELRERSQKKNLHKDDNYWKELNGEGGGQKQEENKDTKKKKIRILKKKNKEAIS